MLERSLESTDEPNFHTLLVAWQESQGKHQVWDCWCGHNSYDLAENPHFWYAGIACRDCFVEAGNYAAAAYWRPYFKPADMS